MARRGGLRGVVAGILAAGIAGSAVAGEPALCLSDPGEPVPLPQVNDADGFRARWAELRARELALEASRAEGRANVTSQRLWRRVLCLDPDHAGARDALVRTASVRVHRPELRWGPPAERPADDAWRALAEPLIVTRGAPEPPPEPPAQTQARELLAAAEESLAAARFSEALGRALAARDALAEGPPDATARTLEVRVGVIAATAQVALGDDDGARESLALALAIDPALELDPDVTSPKVLAALEAARAEARAR